MFDVILFEPEIPPNTGNIIRLCANTGARLHLIKPLGFKLEDRQLQRAGLDYHEYASVTLHENWEVCRDAFNERRVFAVTTRGTTQYSEIQYADADVFLFGPETRGLPSSILQTFTPDRRIRVPMKPDSRSLNLSNTVAIVVYEAWRQAGFTGGG